MVLTEEEIKQLKQQFFALTLRTLGDPEKVRREYYGKDAAARTRFSLYSRTGEQLYRAMQDEELLRLLRKAAEKLGHSPSQKEVLWVFREYIKLRFEKWPYALAKAGLAKSAGSGGRSAEESLAADAEKKKLLEELKVRMNELGYIPHPSQIPDLKNGLKRWFCSWGDVLTAAGIDARKAGKGIVHRIPDLEPEYWKLLDEIENFARKQGRTPLSFEVDRELRTKISERCGGWRNALYQIGLEPAVRIRPFADCYLDHRKEEKNRQHSRNLNQYYYRVLNLDDGTKHDLETLRRMIHRTGKIPGKQEVPDEMRKRLTAACGTWKNVLWQIDIVPGEKEGELRGNKKKRGRR